MKDQFTELARAISSAIRQGPLTMRASVDLIAIALRDADRGGEVRALEWALVLTHDDSACSQRAEISRRLAELRPRG